jgi:hypothetical protein
MKRYTATLERTSSISSVSVAVDSLADARARAS